MPLTHYDDLDVFNWLDNHYVLSLLYPQTRQLIHDIRNALGIILSSAEIMAEEDNPDIRAQMSNTIIQTVQRIVQMSQASKSLYSPTERYSTAELLETTQHFLSAPFSFTKAVFQIQAPSSHFELDNGKWILESIILAVDLFKNSFSHGSQWQLLALKEDGNFIFGVTQTPDVIPLFKADTIDILKTRFPHNLSAQLLDSRLRALNGQIETLTEHPTSIRFQFPLSV